MGWEAVGAIAGVIGALLAFISIIVQSKSDKQRETQINSKPVGHKRSRDNEIDAVPSNLPVRRMNYPSRNTSNVEMPRQDPFSENYHYAADVNEPEPKLEEHYNPYAPYLYFSVGLIGACGGVASILVPWLLIQGSIWLECLIYPLLILGVIGGVIFALFIDNYFQMNKAKAYLRFPLCILSGLIGGWLGLLVIIVTSIILGVAFQGSGGGYIESGGNTTRKNTGDDEPLREQYRRIRPLYDLSSPKDKENTSENDWNFWTGSLNSHDKKPTDRNDFWQK